MATAVSAKQFDKKNNQNENDKPTFEEVVSFEDEPSEGMKQRNEFTNRQTMRGTKGEIRQAASWSTIQQHEDEVKKNTVMSGDFGIRLAQPKNRLSENQSESEKTMDLPNHLSSVVDESEAAKVADSSANLGQIAGQETETISESYEIHSAPSQTERKTLQEIRQQIFQSIRSRQHAITTEYKELTIRLNPAHLGKLIVRIAQKSNAVAVHVQASLHEAQQLLMSELSQLRVDLQEQNINLANLEVSVGNESAFQQSGQQHAFSSHHWKKSGQSIRTANRTDAVVHSEPTPISSYRRTPDTLSIVLQSPQANYENRNELSGIPRNQAEASTHRAMSLSEDVDIEQNIEAPCYEEALNSRIPVSEPHLLAQHTADFPKSGAEHFSKEKIQQLNVQRSPDIAALSTSSTTAVQPLPLSFLVIPSHNETAPKNPKTIENDDPMGRREDLTQNGAHLTHLQEIAHPISSEELRESFIAPPTVDKSTFSARFQNRTSIISEQQLLYPEHELAVPIDRIPPPALFTQLRQAQALITGLTHSIRKADEAHSLNTFQISAIVDADKIELNLKTTRVAQTDLLDSMANVIEKELTDGRLASYISTLQEAEISPPELDLRYHIFALEKINLSVNTDEIPLRLLRQVENSVDHNPPIEYQKLTVDKSINSNREKQPSSVNRQLDDAEKAESQLDEDRSQFSVGEKSLAPSVMESTNQEVKRSIFPSIRSDFSHTTSVGQNINSRSVATSIEAGKLEPVMYAPSVDRAPPTDSAEADREILSATPKTASDPFKVENSQRREVSQPVFETIRS
ncbi:MAG: flagellar hook-length control protein FliK, partial [Candidatus Marinimicrobia bacterium]|nr:flagellar hook-length control protein FliK [Candidatus Neomarinimicrobiota bacterium]